MGTLENGRCWLPKNWAVSQRQLSPLTLSIGPKRWVRCFTAAKSAHATTTSQVLTKGVFLSSHQHAPFLDRTPFIASRKSLRPKIAPNRSPPILSRINHLVISRDQAAKMTRLGSEAVRCPNCRSGRMPSSRPTPPCRNAPIRPLARRG